MGDGRVVLAAFQQRFDQALLAADAARLQRHDALRHGLALIAFAGHVVHPQLRFQRWQVARHRRLPACDQRARLGAADRLQRQPRQPQVVRIGGGGQGRFQGGAGILDRPQPLPGDQRRMQGAAVGRGGAQRAPQVLQRIGRTPGLQGVFARQPAHAGGVADRIGQHRVQCRDGVVEATLAVRQLRDQRHQRTAAAGQRGDAAERGLGEGQVLLVEVGETERVQQPRIVGQRLAGARQQRQRAIGIAAAQRQHAVQAQQLRMFRIQPRGGATEPLHFVQIAAAQRQVRAHHVGQELVRIQRGGACQCVLGLGQVVGAEQHAGAQQVQAGVFRRQRDGLVDAAQRGSGVVVLLLRQRQPAVRLRVGGGIGHPGLGDAQRIGVGLAAQGIENVLLHERPAGGKTAL